MITDMAVVKKRAAPYLAAGKILLSKPKYTQAILAARRAQIAWVGGGDDQYIASILAAALPYLEEIFHDDSTRIPADIRLVSNSA